MGRGGLYAANYGNFQFERVQDFYYTRPAGFVRRPGGSFLLGTDMGVFQGTQDALTGRSPLRLSTEGMLNADVVAVAPVSGTGVLYAACGQGYDAGVFRSDDGGMTWSLRSNGIANPDIRSLAVCPGHPDVAYVGTADAIDDTGENGKIYKTTDGGITWTDMSAGIDNANARIIVAIAVDPNDMNTVYASVQGYFGGVYKSTDGGATWTRRAAGLHSMPEMPGFNDNPFINYFAMLSLAIDPTDTRNVYIGAGGCWGGTYVSRDSGDHWLRRDADGMEVDSEVPDPMIFGVHLELFDFDIDPADPSHLLATGDRGAFKGNGQFGLIYESHDRGMTWKLLRRSRKSDYFPSTNTGLAIRPDNGEMILASRDGVEVSGDHGATWQYANEGLPAVARFTRAVTLDPDRPSRVYLGTAFGGVWMRDFEPTPVTLTHFEAAADGPGRVRLAWGVSDAVDHAAFAVDREVAGVRARLDGEPAARGSEFSFTDAAPVPGEVNRYWLVDLDRSGRETSYGPVEVTVPSFRGLILSAAVPNPLHQSTRLSLSLAAPGPASVQVFDAQGRTVATLLDRTLAAGVHDVQWNGAGAQGGRAPAGVYFIRARAGAGQAVRKVILTP